MAVESTVHAGKQFLPRGEYHDQQSELPGQFSDNADLPADKPEKM